MIEFERLKWFDHIVDKDTQEVLQEGTAICADNLNRLETAVESLVLVVNKLTAELEMLQE